MGPAAQQARTEAYMQAHTVGGVSMLDPTGRVQPFPSEAVVVKTRRFGRGGAPEEVLQQQLQRLGDDTQPKQLLLPAKYRNTADTDAAAVAGLGRGGGSDDEDGKWAGWRMWDGGWQIWRSWAVGWQPGSGWGLGWSISRGCLSWAHMWCCSHRPCNGVRAQAWARRRARRRSRSSWRRRSSRSPRPPAWRSSSSRRRATGTSSWRRGR